MKGHCYNVNMGGLFRCCIQNIALDTSERKVGDVLTCPHCQEQVVLGSNNVWKWQPKKEEK